jgi:hypothetical protein
MPLTVNLESRWRAEVNFLLGVGLDEHTVGKSTGDEDIKISGGGGIGGSLMLGYGLSSLWDLSFGMAIQNSSLQPQVENAKGNFFRTVILANIKYRISVASAGFINLCAGISYYLPGDLDMDLSAVSAGAHNIYRYDNTAGFQILAEYEGFFNKDLGWIIGLKYSQVRYDLKSAESNGTSIPIADLPAEIRDEVGDLDGSSIDLVLALVYYF